MPSEAPRQPEATVAHLSQGAQRVIETSCAMVVLKDDNAYKIKKSVDYGFLDFTSPDKRRVALLRELELNQRTAPDIYREVIEIDGESVLVMRRFDTDGVLAEQSGGREGWSPDLDLMQELGETIADFHAAAEICRDEKHARNIKYTIDTNAKNIAVFSTDLGEKVATYDRTIYAAYDTLLPTVAARFRQGYMRGCHGDLHLGNILIENGRPVLFDCIEFNEHLMQIDVLYDLAFLLMDLWVRRHYTAANRVLNAWLDRAARLETDEVALYDALKLLPFYMSVRAGIRCHVTANNGEMDEARRYLDAAMMFLEKVPAALMAVGGLSGSGKSTTARAEAATKGDAPGAVILRSDELRKRRWKCPALEALPPEAYSSEESVRTYKHMFALGAATLAVGRPVIFDATFREKHWRDEAEDVAQRMNVPFEGIWLDVDAQVRAQRIDTRVGDVSDATSEVATQQERVDPKTISWHVR